MNPGPNPPSHRKPEQAAPLDPSASSPRGRQARIVQCHGAAALEVDGQLEPFVAFKPTEHADEALFDSTVNRTVRDMAARGVHVHFVPIYFGWDGPGMYRFTAMDQRIGRVVEADPEARVIVRIQAASMSPRWYLDAHPDHVLRFGLSSEVDSEPSMHETGPVISLASEFWQTHAVDALRALAQHVQQQSYFDNVIGYLPSALNSNEWFIRSYDALRVADFAPVMRRQFAEHMAKTYHISNADVPDRMQRHQGDDGFIFLPDPTKSQAPVTAFYQFLNRRCASIISEHVHALRQAHPSQRIVVGVFYGYQMGLANFHWLADSGHLDMPTLLDDPDGPDFLSSPLEYFSRNTREADFGGFCWAQGPAVDSARLAGKAYFAEDDFCPPLPDQPEGWTSAGNEREDVELMKRNFSFTLCKGNLQWWYDLNGHWFEGQARLRTIEQCSRIAQRAQQIDRSSVSEVAVFVDEQISQRIMLDRQLQRAYCWSSFFESYTDMGAPVDLLMLSDLDKVDCSRYRVMAFPNAFALTLKQRRLIDSLKRDGRVMIFNSAAGLIDPDSGTFDDRSMSRLVGMRVHAKQVLHPLRLSTRQNHPLLQGREDQSFGLFTEVAPVFHVEDSSAQALAHFATRGPVGLAVSDHGNWTSVYCALPWIDARIVRNIVRFSGVHQYRQCPGDVIYANRNYLAIFPRVSSASPIRFPQPRRVWDCFADQWVADEPTDQLKLPLQARTSYLFELR